MNAIPARRHGAVLLHDHSVRFALWAPDAQSVSVELDEGVHPLNAQTDGWFAATLPCRSGQHYRYVIDGELRVPDPASQAQADDVHGASVVVDHAAFRWQHPHWHGRPWHETVLYEIHVGLCGGFAAVEARLEDLRDLGVTAIELMPLGEFPGARNWGYDGTLPFAPESSYGTPDELKSLIDHAHGLGLMVFVDVVYNHFGPDGNYLGQYASAFFRDDLKTPWGPAIDFRQRDVRDFFCENALMWILDYRIDGLRLDAVHAISEKDFLVELAARVHAAIDPGRHVHLVLENENNDAGLLGSGFDAQWNDDAHNALHVLLTGEHEGYYADFARAPIERLARCLSEGFAFQGEADRRGHNRGQPSAHLAPSSFVLFLQNHDQVGNRALGERLTALADAQALRAATVLLLLSPMVPLLFMGEEYGAREPFLYFTDHADELAEKVREGRRNEFAEFARFSGSSERENIPDPNARDTFERSRPEAPGPECEWRDLYRHLLQLRHEYIVPRLPGTRSLGVRVMSDTALSARWRLGDGSLLRIDVNFGSFAVRRLPQGPLSKGLYASGASGSVLAPHSSVVTIDLPVMTRRRQASVAELPA
jgi:maltooligosyltrehalose trehalohydrolase